MASTFCFVNSCKNIFQMGSTYKMGRSVNNLEVMLNRLGWFGVEVVCSFNCIRINWIWLTRYGLTRFGMWRCSLPTILWVLRSHFMKAGLILFMIKMKFQAYLPRSAAFSALLPMLLWLAPEHLAKAVLLEHDWDSLEFAYANEFTNWCKWEMKERPHLVVLGQHSVESRGSAEQTLGALPTLMFSVRKSDVISTASPELDSLNSHCLARMFFCALAWNSLLVLAYIVSCPRLRLK